MPIENADIYPIAAGTAGGVLGGAIVVASKEMTWRYAVYCMLGGIGIGACLSPIVADLAAARLAHEPWQVALAVGFIGGLSVVGLIPAIQAISVWYLRTKSGVDNGGTKP